MRPSRIGLSFDPARADVAGELLVRAFADGALLAGEGFESPLCALAAYALLASDRVHLAEAEMTRALGAAHARGCAGGVAMALTVRGLARLRLGRIGTAESDGLAACAAATGAAGTLRALTFAAAVGVVVDARAERGDDAGALAILAEHGLVGDLADAAQWPALLPRARAHLAAGRAAEALADARRALARTGRHAAIAMEAAPVIVSAQSTLGERRAAIAGGQAQLERARASRAPAAIATGPARARAGTCRRHGDRHARRRRRPA